MRELITVSMEPALKRRIESFAKKHKIKRSQLVKDAIRRYLNVQEFEELRERFVPKAEKAGYFTDEDVFKDRN